jgi:hypothetical protein
MSDRDRVTYVWQGVNRRGVAERGTLESVRGPAAFVERRFREGWRALTVTLDGVEVARIEKVAGRRRAVT